MKIPKNVSLVILSLLVTALALSTAYFAWNNLLLAKWINQQESITPTPASNQNPTPQITISGQVSFYYLKDNQLFYKSTSTSKISPDDITVTTFSPNPSSLDVVYLATKKVTTSPNYTQNMPYAVYHYSPATGVNKKIYELEPKVLPNSDYVEAIRGVVLSDDSKLIAITTSSDIYLYELTTSKLNTVLDTEITDQNRGMVFGYFNPIISPDNQNLLVTKGYYEGSSYAVIDLASNKLTDLPYQSYISGKVPLAWISPNQLLVQTYQDATEPNSENTFLRVDYPALSETEITRTKVSAGFGTYINGKYYFSHTYQVANGKFINNEYVQNLPVYDNHSDLAVLDITDKKVETLVAKNLLDKSGYISSIMVFGDKILYQEYQPGGKYQLYSLDLSSSVGPVTFEPSDALLIDK